MLITHLSHIGVEKIAETDEHVMFKGTFAGCKRIAHSHGMEISDTAGDPRQVPGGYSVAWFEEGGFMCRDGNDWFLTMPRETWDHC
jgi:hypothetical protein